MVNTSSTTNNKTANKSENKDTEKNKVFQQVKQFLHYLDYGKGWDACKAYCIDNGNASFDCQSDALAGIETVAAYALWMQDFVANVSPEFHIDIHSCSFCEETMTVAYVATFHGKHTGPGGPGPATHNEFSTDYAYLVKIDEDEDDKVQSVKKIWNDGYTMKQLGWTKDKK